MSEQTSESSSGRKYAFIYPGKDLEYAPQYVLDTQRSITEAEQVLAVLHRHEEEVPADTRVPELWSMRLSVLGAVLSLPAIVSLLVPALLAESPVHILAFTAYGLGLMGMFLASAAFHRRAGGERLLYKNLDYCAIGLMIAGTFTPYLTVALRTTLGYCVLSSIWTVTLFAAALRLAEPKLSKWTFISVFLIKGWLGLLVAYPLWKALGPRGFGLTILGGLIYSVGTVVFNRNEDEVEPPGFGPHEIWHLCILAGAAVHFWVIRSCMLPLKPF